jgi:hypothetical protein
MRISRTAVAFGLAIPLASIVYFAVSLNQIARVPDQQDWKAAAWIVRSGFKEGDLVAFMPQWAQGASPWLQGLDVDTGENFDWYEASKASRVWLISSMNGRRKTPPEGWNLVRSLALHRTGVSLWTPPPGRDRIYGFSENIDKAFVSRNRGKTRKLCNNFKNGRWYCGAEHPWQYVGLESRDIAGRVRNVIWSHAIERYVVETVWTDVPQGGTLTVHYGLTQRAAEAREGAPVKFTITVDNKPVFSDTLEVDEHGWFRRDIDLPGQAASSVGFKVETPDPQSRQVCFTADIWK